MNTELKTALEILEKEKDISKDVMLDAIEAISEKKKRISV